MTPTLNRFTHTTEPQADVALPFDATEDRDWLERDTILPTAAKEPEDMRLQDTVPPPADPDGNNDDDDSDAHYHLVTSAPRVLPKARSAQARSAPPAAHAASDASADANSDASPGADASPGVGANTRVGKYQLIRELGRGGMGTVHLARDTRLGRLVAIKFLAVSDKALTRRFIAEAKTTAQCNHENIVVLYEADEHEGQPYMVLEYLQGQTLAQVIQSERAAAQAHADQAHTDQTEQPRVLTGARAIELITPVLRALERAHAMGIIHRDLKPDNVMLTDTGTVKVLDFGISKVLAESTNLTADGDLSVNDLRRAFERQSHHTKGMLGTLPYMSPEQINGAQVDARTDIWAVGIILYELLTGSHPMAPLSMPQLDLISRRDVPMPRITEIRPDLGKIAAVIDRCLIKPVEDRIASAGELLRQLTPIAPAATSAVRNIDESPFAGLSAFQEGDADRFYGRDADIANLVTRVRNQPLVTVVGPSGVGKSSLIRAGVIPALKRSGEGWESVVIRPGRQPLEALADVLEQLQGHSTSDRASAPLHGEASRSMRMPTGGVVHDRAALLDRLRKEPGYLGTELRAWAQRKLRRIILLVDQFEELYTTTRSESARVSFLACLASIADDASSPLRVMLTMRSDFLERLATDRVFMAVATRNLVLLAPMDRAGLRTALVNPLAAVGYRCETDDMLDAMLDELEKTAGALPLLQFTASQLWIARDHQRRLITEASYRDMGGIAGTLAKHADQVLAGMPTPQLKIARAIFERLVTPERTRAIVDVNDLYLLPGDVDDIEDVLHALTHARLVVVELGDRQDAGTSGSWAIESSVVAPGSVAGTAEIVHESLITGWPRLRRWLDDNQDDAAMLARVRTAAKDWHRNERTDGLLWTGDVAAEARRWYEGYTGALSGRERAFLDAVSARAARNQRRKRNSLLAIVGLLGALLVAAIIAIVQIQGARAQAEEAVEMAREREQRAVLAEKQAQVAAQQARAGQQRAVDAEAAATEALKKLRASAQSENAAKARADASDEQARDQAERARVAREDELAALWRERKKAREAEAEREKKRLAEQKAERARIAKKHAEKQLKKARRKSLGTLSKTLD